MRNASCISQTVWRALVQLISAEASALPAVLDWLDTKLNQAEVEIMTNLIISADELLKTRTIPELRDLVYSLENDGNSKITELQVMVGSKYHDFIQSADAIAAMQQKSEFLESNLCRFLQLSEEIVLKTKDLLSRTVDSQSSDSHLVTPLTIYKGIII